MFTRLDSGRKAGTTSRIEGSLAAARERPEDVEQVLMTVENGSKLAISWLPTFRFMPRWSSRHRTTVGKVLEQKGSRLLVVFNATDHPAPPMAWYTTFLEALWPLPVPALPPGVTIEIKSNELKGWIDVETGEIDLHFVSDFGNMAFGHAASSEPLKVDSRMTTEPLYGRIFQAIGRRMADDGSAKLVALSDVPVTKDKFQNRFLNLPTDALSLLNVHLQFAMKASGASARADAAMATART